MRLQSHEMKIIVGCVTDATNQYTLGHREFQRSFAFAQEQYMSWAVAETVLSQLVQITEASRFYRT